MIIMHLWRKKWDELSWQGNFHVMDMMHNNMLNIKTHMPCPTDYAIVEFCMISLYLLLLVVQPAYLFCFGFSLPSCFIPFRLQGVQNNILSSSWWPGSSDSEECLDAQLSRHRYAKCATVLNEKYAFLLETEVCIPSGDRSLEDRRM